MLEKKRWGCVLRARKKQYPSSEEEGEEGWKREELRDYHSLPGTSCHPSPEASVVQSQTVFRPAQFLATPSRLHRITLVGAQGNGRRGPVLFRRRSPPCCGISLLLLGPAGQ